MKDYIDGKPIQKRLVAAYIPGWPVQNNLYTELKKCDEPDETGCICSWSTYEWGYTSNTMYYYKNAICVNPISWKTDGEYAARDCNAGVVLPGFNSIRDGCSDAQIHDNILWTHKPDVPGKILFKTKNYHIGDFNLFWYDVRRNFDLSVKTFLGKN